MGTVTVGGLVLGLGLLARKLILWWPGAKGLQKDPWGAGQHLLPFIYGWCYGMLAILCTGGLVGVVADVTLWGSNWIGDAAYVWGVGGDAQRSVTRPAVSALTAGGTTMMLILTFVFLALMKKNEHLRKDLRAGAWCGICLGLSNGIAGAAAIPLASLANLAGAWISTEVLV